MYSKHLIARLRPLLYALSRFPLLKRIIKKIGLYFWRLEVRLSIRDSNGLYDPNKIHWISPQEIEFSCQLEDYNKYQDRGAVIGGDLDENVILFERLDVFQALESHFQRGAVWEDTDYYHRVVDELAAGKTKWGCKTKSDFDSRLQDLEHLYEEIREHGYKSQIELATEGDVSFLGEDEITLRINRNGWPLFEDGRHRLSIAKLLELGLIPVKITARHAQWVDFIQEVFSYADAHDGTVYQPITHYDLCDVPSSHSDERFDLISKHMPVDSGEILDIGAHWGYFCHRFEEIGFTCYAVESDFRAGYFLKRLKLAERRNFDVIISSIFDYRDKSDFDVVLSLNIFHHFLKTEEKYTALIEFLSRLNTLAMFFQTHVPGSQQMQGAYRDYEPEEFVSFVQTHARLDSSMYIGTASDRRQLYLLTRT